MKFAVVAIGYNRVNGMARLLNSLSVADFMGDAVDLIVSIDNSGSTVVEDYVNSFTWAYGNKIVKTYPKRMGLRNHVLRCGDYVFGYDAIAVFEDDIFVAPTFYKYMKAAVCMYHEDENIAGISLYSHMWSEYNKRPFFPVKCEFDNYFLQYAQSWGQVWMPQQWKAFRNWYDENQGEITTDYKTPSHITDWPKTSWLKYHIKYCIECNKYFVYPYVSYSTNFVDIGENCKTSNTVYQVPMAYGTDSKFHFCEFGDKEAVYYDAFFERQFLESSIGLPPNSLCVDLYGNKPTAPEKYLLTTNRMNYKIVKSYGLKIRPHEMNAVNSIEGNDIFLYDTEVFSRNVFENDFDLSRWYYDSRVFDYKYIVKVLIKIIVKKTFKK